MWVQFMVLPSQCVYVRSAPKGGHYFDLRSGRGGEGSPLGGGGDGLLPEHGPPYGAGTAGVKAYIFYLLRGPAAVDQQAASSDQSSGRRGGEHHRRSDVLRPPDPAGRNALLHPLREPRLRRRQLVVERGFDEG